MHENRRGRLRSTETIAGWVFADMLLVLFMVGLGSVIPVDPPEPEPEPEPVVEIVGMETQPIKFTIDIDANALRSGDKEAQAEARDKIKASTRDLSNRGDRAAFVIIFGGADEVSKGQQVAMALAPELNRARPRVFPSGTATRFFWESGLSYGTVRVEVFVYTTRVSDQQ